MKNIKGLEAIKREILELRGSEVKVYGEIQTIEKSVNEITIDIVDVIERLEAYEVDELEVIKLCEECEGGNPEKAEDCETCFGDGFTYDYIDALEALEIMEDSGEVVEVKSDNSYNWDSPISNNFDFTIYKNVNNNNVYVTFKVHKYGDIRTNYTDAVVLEFNRVSDFTEVIAENSKTIDINGYSCEISMFNDGIEVYDEYYDHVGTFYVDDIEELKRNIEETLNINIED